MIQGDAAADANTALTLPVIDAVVALKKTHGLAAFQARAVDGNGVQCTAVDSPLNIVELHDFGQQFTQRLVIKQRDGIVFIAPANQQAAGKAGK